MSASNTKRKRAAPSQTPVSTPEATVTNSLLDSYDFLAPNEYTENTIGIQAFLLRKSVGDINFSDIIDDSEKPNRQGQTPSFVSLLEDKRSSLTAIEASIEKCLMLTRLIAYIKENGDNFTKLISDIRLTMQLNMKDDQTGHNPTDFRQREQDFNVRKNAQEIRRLFYHNDVDAKNPKNLVYLQNRTTEQLMYITTQMSRDSKSRQTYNKELENIFKTSFMIVSQPHSGVNPVTIYDRRGPGEYTAKISVTIVSLLHDFMQAHPNLIELYDIEPSLCPPSQYYKLEEPRSLSWKKCQLHTSPGGKSQTFLYAELSAITIEQSSKADTRVRFAQLLHSFKFAIKLQFNLAENNKIPIYQFALETLPFGIGAHNNQISQLLTRVLLDDIRRFSKIQPADVKVIQMYMQRYFIQRTGVRPNDCVNIYLEQELIKAINRRSNTDSLEDIYLDFLVNFVHQVEFMAKHPILAMFHADGLFLAICQSERAAEAIVQLSVSGAPVIGLRFNSIRVDYSASTTASALPRTVKVPPCAVRVDIYNRAKRLQYRTFDSSILANDISKFVSAAKGDNVSHIRILSNFDDRTNGKNFMSFKEFEKYYHSRLQEISKSDEKYKLVTDLVENVNDGNADEDNLDNFTQDSDLFSPLSPNSIASLPPVTPGIFENEYSSDGNSRHDYMSIPYDSSNHQVTSPQNVLSSSDQSQQQQPPQQIPYVNNQDAILKYVLSQPNMIEQVVRQFGNSMVNISAPTEPSQQMVQQPQVQYHVQQLPYQQQVPVQIPQQRQSPQVTYQQQPLQTVYHQPQTQLYQTSPMQFQTSVPQQQQQPYLPQNQQQVLFQQQQRPTLPSIIHYLPTNTNQPTSFTRQPQQFPTVLQTNGNNNIPQQVLEKMHGWNITDENSNQTTTTNSIQPETTTNQTSMITFDEELQQYLDELTNPKSTENNQ